MCQNQPCDEKMNKQKLHFASFSRRVSNPTVLCESGMFVLWLLFYSVLFFIHSIFFKLVHIRKKLWSDMKMQEGGCVWVMGGEGWIDLCDYIFAHCCIIQPRRL